MSTNNFMLYISNIESEELKLMVEDLTQLGMVDRRFNLLESMSKDISENYHKVPGEAILVRTPVPLNLEYFQSVIKASEGVISDFLGKEIDVSCIPLDNYERKIERMKLDTLDKKMEQKCQQTF